MTWFVERKLLFMGSLARIIHEVSAASADTRL
jgi:hypothetical protein